MALIMDVILAQALPLVEASRDLDTRNKNININVGVPPTDRTIFTLISLLCMTVLSLLLGSRFTRLRQNGIWKRKVTSMLVLALYSIVMSFIVCSAVMVAGQGLHTNALCIGGTWICLIFYTFAKGIIYIFFVERIHIVRAPFVRRSRDWIYLFCMALVFVALVAQCINAYVHPVTEMRESDGRCQYGIPGIASIPGLAIDLIGSISLTCVFFYLLRPVIKVHGPAPVFGILGSSKTGEASMAQHNRNETAIQRNIRILVWKSIVGGILVIIPTTANMIQFVITDGRELGMICSSICVLDLTWDTVVLHWLSFGSSAKAEQNSTYSTQASTRAPLIQHLTSPKPGAKVADHELLKEPQSALTRSVGAENIRKDCAPDIIPEV